jgi:hypothetical protein
MSQVASKRIVLIDIPEACLELEYNQDFVVLHLPRVTKFGKREFNIFKTYFADLVDFFNTFGIDILYAAFDDKKVQKLATAFGFEFVGINDKYKVYRYASSSNGSRRCGRCGGDNSLCLCKS